MKKYLLPILFILIIGTLPGFVNAQQSYCDTVSFNSGLNEEYKTCSDTFISLSANPGFESYQWSNGDTLQQTIFFQSGIYTLTLVDDSSCVFIDTILIGILPAGINTPDSFICNGESIEVNLFSLSRNTSSLQFQDSSNYAVFVDSLLPASNQSRTISFWVYNPGQPGTTTLFTYGDIASNSGFSIKLSSADSLLLRINQQEYTCPIPISQNQWHHVQVYTDPSYKYGFIIDGVSSGSQLIQLPFNTVLTGEAYLGKNSLNDSLSFMGFIDEVQIFNDFDPLFESEAMIHFNSLLNESLVYSFDLNSGLNNNPFSVGGIELIHNGNLNSSVPFIYYNYQFNSQSNFFDYQQNISPNTSQAWYAVFEDGIQTCIDSVFIQVSGIPELPDTILSCNENQVELDAGTGWDQVIWNTGDQTQLISVNISGMYSVELSDSFCVFHDSTFVSTLWVSINQADTQLCYGNSILLEASSGSGTFLWSNESTAQSLLTDPFTSADYSVSVNDSYQSCSASVTINILPLPVFSIPDSINFCNPVQAYVQVDNPVFESYQWNTGDTSYILPVNTSGEYIVTVSDSYGCTNSDTSIINIVSLQIAESDTFLCQPEPWNLTVVSNTTNYQWWNGSSQAQVSFMADSSSYYSVSYQNNGFYCSDSVSIVLADPIQINLPDTLVYCNLGEITLSAPSGYTAYSWSNSATTASINVNNSGLYTVTIFDEYACSASDSIAVSLININLSQSDSLICPGEMVLISTNSSQYNYLWNTGETSPVIFVYPEQSTNYQLLVNDGISECYYNAMVNVFDVVNPEILGNNAYWAGDSGIFAATQTSPDYTYFWNVSGASLLQNYIDSILVGFQNGGSSFIQFNGISPDGCLTDTAELEVFVQSLGINDNKENLFQVFPNPFIDKIHLKLLKNKGYFVGIYNSHASLVKMIQVNANTAELDLSALRNGIYFIILYDLEMNFEAVSKVIKQ